MSCADSKDYCRDDYFRKKCPLTCGLCTPDPNQCYDFNTDCSKFEFECNTVPQYTQQCPKTCGNCDDRTTVTVPGKTTVIPTTLERTTVPARTTVIPDCVDHLIECPQFSKPCSDGLAIQCPLSCGVCNGNTIVPRTTVPPRTTVLLKTTVRTTVPPPTTKTTKKPTPTTPKPPCKDASPNCPTWAKNGFCTNTFYPPEKRKEYCAKTCKYC
ncbi:hypothetical protein L3Y34_005486 [Caenorhabditis briggsae]|uniref:ShKT domain-containing protein n=1 Tax=Caenorhabditis briggsae TaxID=6238 RepID=A0AAE9AJA4_CAEBR|nr:hypothetical protein L3Y34_005486 [Caenorhabditis briggsae]